MCTLRSSSLSNGSSLESLSLSPPLGSLFARPFCSELLCISPPRALRHCASLYAYLIHLYIHSYLLVTAHYINHLFIGNKARYRVECDQVLILSPVGISEDAIAKHPAGTSLCSQSPLPIVAPWTKKPQVAVSVFPDVGRISGGGQVTGQAESRLTRSVTKGILTSRGV